MGSRVYAWEPVVLDAVVRSATAGNRRWLLRAINVVLGGIEVAPYLGVILTMLVFWSPWWTLLGFATALYPTGLALAGVLLITSYDDVLKRWANRGRPDDPDELGFPSGDVALTTFWCALVLGLWGGLLCGALVGLGRMAQRRHWPLDVVGGLGEGAWGAVIAWLLGVRG